jgi:hypothetical protein
MGARFNPTKAWRTIVYEVLRRLNNRYLQENFDGGIPEEVPF